jgi:hypothetical protein
VAQLYLQELGSLFVLSYDSQVTMEVFETFCTDRVENIVSNNKSIAVEACLLRRCPETGYITPLSALQYFLKAKYHTDLRRSVLKGPTVAYIPQIRTTALGISDGNQSVVTVLPSGI